jgi:hypothetical protein
MDEREAENLISPAYGPVWEWVLGLNWVCPVIPWVRSVGRARWGIVRLNNPCLKLELGLNRAS